MLANAACEGNPVGPSPDRYRNPRLILFCQVPVDANVSCRASLFDVPRWGDSQDVTFSSTWSVEPPAVAAFTAPGLLTPVGRGEATIHVRYAEHSEAVASTFLVDPRATAQWLYFLQVKVVEDDGQTAIAGVTIQMADGYQAGAGCITNQFGFCMIERLLTGETFTARASKSGYHSLTFTYRVDPPVGVGNPPFREIRLSRVSA